MKKKVAVLGCTGSIGTNTLSIIESFPDLFELTTLSANKNKDSLLAQARHFNCKNTCLVASEADKDVQYTGTAGLLRLIQESDADIVVNGIAGSAGLRPSVTALECGKDLALANKETIVMAGQLVKTIAAEHNCAILPVDSEHSAVFNLIQRFGTQAVDSIVLTASGGPFRTWTSADIAAATAADALKHPTWNMGSKITVDSASLANKGLEVIEACLLFDMDPARIQVAVHPQSLVHSLIRTKDGVLYAQISKPDMRHPILSALTWPEFKENTLEPLDLCAGSFEQGLSLSFYPPRFADFPMLTLAYTAAKSGGSYAIAYNAADEIAVDAFFKQQIPFTGIAELTEKVLSKDWTSAPHSTEEVFALDKEARIAATQELK